MKDPLPASLSEATDSFSSLPPKAPTVPAAPTPSRSARTPDGADSSKKFSFKGYMLDEASAALAQRVGGNDPPMRYTAETANLVSPGGRIKEKISNPSPSLQRFLAMSQSAQLVSISAPSPPSSATKNKKFSFDILDTATKEFSIGQRAAEIEKLKSERLERQVEGLSTDVCLKDLEIAALRQRDEALVSAALKKTEASSAANDEVSVI